MLSLQNNKSLFVGCFLFVFLFVISSTFADDIPISVKGIAQSTKNRQMDYREAVIDAKIKAIEQGGAEIRSLTQITNFQLKEKSVESKSEGVLLPGYQIIDIGYVTDGTYQIVLTGKIKSKTEARETGVLRYAVSLYKKGKLDEANNELEKILNGRDEESRAGAIYYQAYWKMAKNGYASAANDMDSLYDKINAWYPNSPWTSKLELLIKRNREYLSQIENATNQINNDRKHKELLLYNELKQIFEPIPQQYTFKKFDSREIAGLISRYINGGLEGNVKEIVKQINDRKLDENVGVSGTIRYGSGGATYIHSYIYSQKGDTQIFVTVAEASDGLYHSLHTSLKFGPLHVTRNNLLIDKGRSYERYIE